jgi:hypothetical protein
MYVICFYSRLLSFLYWLMWIIQSLTSSLFPAFCLVPEQDLSCSTYLSYRPVSSFIQLYLYRLLAAASLKESSPTSTICFTLRPNPLLWVPCLPLFCKLIVAFCRFRRGMTNQSLSTPGHRIDPVASDYIYINPKSKNLAKPEILFFHSELNWF